MMSFTRPADIPGAGSAGEPLPASLPYDMGYGSFDELALNIIGGKPDYSSPLLCIEDGESQAALTRSDDTFDSNGLGATAVGGPPAVVSQRQMGAHSVIPRLWKAGLDSWGSILGGGSVSQRGMGEDNEGSVLLAPPAWTYQQGGANVTSLKTPVPGAYADTAYLPSVYVG